MSERAKAIAPWIAVSVTLLAWFGSIVWSASQLQERAAKTEEKVEVHDDRISLQWQVMIQMHAEFQAHMQEEHGLQGEQWHVILPRAKASIVDGD